jgi:hypothetical protein
LRYRIAFFTEIVLKKKGKGKNMRTSEENFAALTDVRGRDVPMKDPLRAVRHLASPAGQDRPSYWSAAN